ncbi:MAG TPA: TrkA C-terminal domain-containing protein [Saprospiraceae bacterium]|nr:hypothetical protein [Saprospiraceae bacterium]HRO09096.1 TrkA C-terminal domain-containing protein [Saprospiraceae bacterium]HRP42443.1 TrkA C-terminal domain-containing protein [Saprospiraceae bacterium]
MSKYLIDNPLILLFLVIAVGYLVGNIKIKNSGLGTSAVLFVGLVFGAWNPGFDLPEIIFQIGIVFYVYTIAIKSGPVFFDSFSKNGWRDISFVLFILTISAVMTVVLYYLLDFDKATITGIYTGSSTNTTALASVIDMVRRDNQALPDITSNLVMGYTFSYPMGVLGIMIVIKLMESIFKIDYQKEKEILRKNYPIDDDIASKTIEITNPDIHDKNLSQLITENNWNIVFGRMDSLKRGMILSSDDIKLEVGDKIIVVGTVHELKTVEKLLGKEIPVSISHNRKDYDIVRIFVSNMDVVGRKLSSLNIKKKFRAIITRIRRGDTDMVANANTILEMGDRIRFVAKRDDVPKLQKFFGDSYHSSSKIDLFSFGIGITMGILLGMIEFELYGGLIFKLGYAGGPLVAGLVLGALRRTGSLVWSIPYSSNVTLNQLGLSLLLAVIGVKSGTTLIENIGDGIWIKIFAAGTFLTMSTAALSLWIGYRLVKIPYSLLLGFISHQPAILDFATDITKNRVPSIGYSFMYPISLILKILFAQLLFMLL